MKTTQTMKPFPYTEVSAIEREMCDMRDEVLRLRVQLENAQSCLNALQQKRKDVITEAREGDLFEQMFGDDDGRGQDSAFMDDNFGG